MSYTASTGNSQRSLKPETSPVSHLAKMWAKKYVQRLDVQDDVDAIKDTSQYIADKLKDSLRTASIDAWSHTEKLIGREIKRHGIERKLIDPWRISEDSFTIFNKAIETYSQQQPPEQLARTIGPFIGQVRAHHTAIDARVIGFVAMQMHYTGYMLLREVPLSQRARVYSYFKVVDDYLYMPLQRAYDASASHDFDSPIMQVVQQLMPISSNIAQTICERVIAIYPTYHTHSGLLANPIVKIASLRDTEMFQVYLWVCVLEDSIGPIQHELFPLCVMLYPALKVQWELVRQMIHLLGQEINIRLGEKQRCLFQPYFGILWEMFSPDVFPDTLD
jgi:hypothetical protein